MAATGDGDMVADGEDFSLALTDSPVVGNFMVRSLNMTLNIASLDDVSRVTNLEGAHAATTKSVKGERMRRRHTFEKQASSRTDRSIGCAGLYTYQQFCRSMCTDWMAGHASKSNSFRIVSSLVPSGASRIMTVFCTEILPVGDGSAPFERPGEVVVGLSVAAGVDDCGGRRRTLLPIICEVGMGSPDTGPTANTDAAVVFLGDPFSTAATTLFPVFVSTSTTSSRSLKSDAADLTASHASSAEAGSTRAWTLPKLAMIEMGTYPSFKDRRVETYVSVARFVAEK